MAGESCITLGTGGREAKGERGRKGRRREERKEEREEEKGEEEAWSQRTIISKKNTSKVVRSGSLL